MSKREWVGSALVAGLALAGLYLVSERLGEPVVFEDHLTGECLRVIYPSGTGPYSCTRLPVRYRVEKGARPPPTATVTVPDDDGC